jgi:hypothetical protein
MRRKDLLLIGAVVTMLVVAAVPGMCQPGGQGGGRMGAQGGNTGGPGMGPGMMMAPMAPQATMVVAEGVLYVACEGKITAYDARSLEKIAEVTYWEPPARTQGGRGAGGAAGG